jgi:DNA-binding CsgD family transcriptional regulator
MIRDEAHWLSVADSFGAAALDGKGWYDALDALAQATGSRTGELIGVGSNAAVPFNIMTNMDPGFHKAFVEAGGGDPAINPRVGAGMKSPVLKVMADSDFITPDEYRRNPHYQEFARPWDVPYICLTTLERENGMLIGLAVVRSQQQGHITPQERAVFASLAPHVRAAVRTQLALEGQGAALITGAMEALSIPAFVCDRYGRVRTLTPDAERLVEQGRVDIRLGQLQAPRAEDSRNLEQAIDRAALGLVRPDAPLAHSVVLRGAREDALPLVLEIVSLPNRQFEFSFAPRVLVVARGANDGNARKKMVLHLAYDLTAAEADVAVQLSAGNTVEAIAARRGVAIATVRAQVKTIFAKVGVHHQVELVARLLSL